MAWRGAGLLTGALAATASFGGPLIFSDNFNAPDIANFDQSDQTGRRQGLLGELVQLRSSRIQHGILNNELNFLRHATSGDGRIRFHESGNANVRWDFAQGDVGQKILEDGGLRITFEWTPPNNTLADWMCWTVGFPDIPALAEPAIRVNHAETDFGILFRANGGTQYFDNAAAVTGGEYDASVVAKRVVSIDLSFTSFEDGSDVTATARVDGQEVLSGHVFQWENNGGALYMEWGNYVHGSKADNISISTLAPDGFVVQLNGKVHESNTFYSSVAAGGLVGTLTATINDTPETSTFTFASGAGDTDNGKFQITGARLEGNGTDLKSLADGTTLSVRVRATGVSPTTSVEQVFILTVIADSDADQLPDTWELAKTGTGGQPGNLASLTGTAAGPGPGAGTGNFDGDSLTDREEFVLASSTFPDINPTLADSDGDSLEDGSEIEGAGSRPPTNPTMADTDRDGLNDGIESNIGLFASASDTGSNPTVADTDGDFYQDDFEVQRGSSPNDNTALPTQPAAISIVGITTDESTGISGDITYTHTISGGYETSINGVFFEKLGPTTTPANFAWAVSSGANKSETAALNNGDWLPADAGVVDAGLSELLGGFTYSSTGAERGHFQTFTLSGLTAGQAYELRLYGRLWDTEGSGRPIDFYFTNGSEVTRALVPTDRPLFMPPLALPHEAWYIAYKYVAEGDSLVLRALVPTGAVTNSGSYHLYGLSNQETDAVTPPAADIRVTTVSYQATPSPSFTLTFTSTAGRNYTLETSSSLLSTGNPGGWSLLGTIPAAAGSTTNYIDSTPGVASSPVRYYRIREAR